jgi:hypothetical protein
MLNQLPRFEGQWLRIILRKGEANISIGPRTRAQSHLYPTSPCMKRRVYQVAACTFRSINESQQKCVIAPDPWR